MLVIDTACTGYGARVIQISRAAPAVPAVTVNLFYGVDTFAGYVLGSTRARGDARLDHSECNRGRRRAQLMQQHQSILSIGEGLPKACDSRSAAASARTPWPIPIRLLKPYGGNGGV